MFLPPKALALSASLVAALTAATVAQNGTARRNGSASETVTASGYIDWVEQSDVSALADGVIDKMELKIGGQVDKNGVIGTLHAEKAELNVAKAKVAATNKGELAKAEAQKELAKAELARMYRANQRVPDAHSPSEIEKGIAEVKVADALIVTAKDNTRLAEAELKIAEQILSDHTIRAPFNGIIVERKKNPGESVKSNEPVVRMGKVDTLKFQGDIALQYADRVQPGMIVDVKPEIEGADLPIEQKRFRGKVTYVSREIISVSKTVVTVFAEVQNNKQLELLPGLRANLTIYPNPASAPPAPADMLPEPEEKPAPAAAAVAPSTAPPTVGLAPRR